MVSFNSFISHFNVKTHLQVSNDMLTFYFFLNLQLHFAFINNNQEQKICHEVINKQP